MPQGRKEWKTKENKDKFWQNHDAIIGAATVGKKACDTCLGTR